MSDTSLKFGSFSGLKGCVFAGLLAAAAIALAWTISWEDVFRVIFDLSWRFPALSWALPAGMLVTLFCATSKGLVKSFTACVLVKLAIPALIVWMIMAFMSSIERLELTVGSKADYASIMQTPPDHLVDLTPGSHDSNRLIRKIRNRSEGNVWLTAKECAYVATEDSPYYRVRLNGVPVGQAACRDGVNVLEWEHIQQ